MTNHRRQRSTGVLDIRNVIGALLSLYGVILLITRLIEGDEGGERTTGLNANLWAGLALLVVGGAFLIWAILRPVVVPDSRNSSEPAERAEPTD